MFRNISLPLRLPSWVPVEQLGVEEGVRHERALLHESKTWAPSFPWEAILSNRIRQRPTHFEHPIQDSATNRSFQFLSMNPQGSSQLPLTFTIQGESFQSGTSSLNSLLFGLFTASIGSFTFVFPYVTEAKYISQILTVDSFYIKKRFFKKMGDKRKH